MLTRRALWALPILLALAGCGGGSNGPSDSGALAPAPSASALRGRIVYTQTVPTETASNGVVNYQSTFIANADGTASARVTPASLRSAFERPTLSPDGSRVAFGTQNFVRREFYIINSDGSNLQLLSGDFGNGTPAWSPDGSQLAYIVYVPARFPISVINVIAADGQSAPRRITSAESGRDYNVVDEPTFAPDGKTIAFTALSEGVRQIFVVPADGSAPPTRLTSSANFKSAPVFAPDGRTLAFVSSNGNSVFGDEIRALDLKTLKERVLPARDGGKKRLSYSPDGRFLAYDADNGMQPIFSRIYIMRADGSSESRAFDASATTNQKAPSWGR